MRSARRVPLFSPMLWAFLCALAIRVALPAGTMVSAEAGRGPVIVLCSGAGVFEAELDADGKPTPLHHHEKGAHDHDVCPFAGGHAYLSPTAASTPAPAAFAWRRQTLAPPSGLAGALRLRAPPPPARAPPPSASA